jgi:hypothetical protein
VVEEDGLVFDPSTVTTERIAEDTDYKGVRTRFQGNLGKARIAMPIDLGFSDVITPGPVSIFYPTMIGHPSAELMAHSRETVIAEKLEAMVSLGQLNSRMKDFFDLWLLAQTQDFAGPVVAEAILRTFNRRQTQIIGDPVCFKNEFARDAVKAVKWTAFIRNGRLNDVPASFKEVVASIRIFLKPAIAAIVANREFIADWHASGPWDARENRLETF